MSEVIGFILIAICICVMSVGIFITRGSKSTDKPLSKEGSLSRVERNCYKIYYYSTQLPEYVVIDLETTGLSRYDDKIVQIAAVRYVDNLEAETYCTYVNPGRHIPASASAIHGITDQMVSGAPTFEQVRDDFRKFIGQSIIVGYNIGFDLGFLRAATGNGFLRYNQTIDVLKCARDCLAGLPNYKLQTVANSIGVTGQSHDALFDCRATAKVLQYLCEPEGIPKEIRLGGEATRSAQPKAPVAQVPVAQAPVTPKSLFAGKRVLIDGAFQQFTRDELVKTLEEKKAVLRVNLTESVDIILLGQNHGSKYQRAQELIQRGCTFRFIEEAELVHILSEEESGNAVYASSDKEVSNSGTASREMR